MAEVNTDEVYKKLKKQNGEGVAKVIRAAVLLDVPNIVHVLEFAGNNPDEVKKLVPAIRARYKVPEGDEYIVDKDPITLLSEAGYDAFVVENAEQKNSIKKYFRHKERLCTFNDPTRHKDFYIIHAVKRGAENIKPSKNPERQDEYGTSVISIQIAKTGGFISIKNRYNHTVDNPDNTFNSNPDNIIKGLSRSLQSYFNVHFYTTSYTIPRNFEMVNDQFVKFNYEIEDVYCGPNYYFRGNCITRLNTDYQVMLDYFVLDTRTGKVMRPVKKKIKRFVRRLGVLSEYYEDVRDQDDWIGFDDDCAYRTFGEIFNDKKIKVQLNPNNKAEKIIFADNVQIATVNDGKITELYLPNTEIGNNFLFYNTSLKLLKADNLKKVGKNFLYRNWSLNELYLPKLKRAPIGFLEKNCSIRVLQVPKGCATKLKLRLSKYDLIKKMEERNSFIYKVKRVLDSMILQDE